MNDKIVLKIPSDLKIFLMYYKNPEKFSLFCELSNLDVFEIREIFWLMNNIPARLK